eukprot:gene16780-19955_t
MSGFINDCNEEQKKCLEELRALVNTEKDAWRAELELPAEKTLGLWTVSLEEQSKERDIVLLKFLRAREFKVDAAKTMLINTLKWRKSFNVDNIGTEEFANYDNIGVIHKTDKEGRPVMLNFYCNIDVNTIFADGVDQFLRWKVQQMERAIAQLSATGWAVENLVVVHDYNDVSMLGMDKRTKAASSQTIKILQDNYPELLARKFFINVPWFFEKLYGFFTAFSNERTRSKFIVCANNYRPQLLNYIDADNLWPAYGGMSSNTTGAKIECATVKSRESLRKDLGELESDSMIEWEFTCEDRGDTIGFGIVKSADSTTTTATSPTSPAKPQDKEVLAVTQHEYNAGSYKVEEKGNYTFLFDNTSSFFAKKIVHYRVTTNQSSTSTETLSEPAALTTTTPTDISSTPAAEEPSTETTTTTTTTTEDQPKTTTADEIDLE